jgi:pectate lyase
MRESKGLSFINAGNDLIYAALSLYRLDGVPGALEWAKHLERQYVRARDPNTGLGAFQFTRPKKTAEAPGDTDTLSWYGDRAQRQFGPEFGSKALEAWLLLPHHAFCIYGENALMLLGAAKRIGGEGAEILEWVRSGLAAFARYAYSKETNAMRPMFADGTDLSGFTLKRDGYYGAAGARLDPYPAEDFFLPFAKASLISGDAELWITARSIARGMGLGDLGARPGEEPRPNLDTSVSDARSLFALIDLHSTSACSAYLDLARRIGDNIVSNTFTDGYFAFPGARYAKIDSTEALSLLALQAAIEGKPEFVPDFIDGGGYVSGDYEHEDGSVSHDMKSPALFAMPR